MVDEGSEQIGWEKWFKADRPCFLKFSVVERVPLLVSKVSVSTIIAFGWLRYIELVDLTLRFQTG